MKKKLLALSAALCGVTIALAGCQEALLSSDVKMEKSGAGTKTITAVIYGDASLQAGRLPDPDNPSGGLVGNNTSFLLVWGTDLENKVKSYSALDDVTVKSTVKDGNTELTITYSFTSIADYNTKTKTLAKNNASDIEDATWTANADGTYTYKENCDNTQYSVDNIFYSLYNDPTAFAKNADGINMDDQGGHTGIYKVMSVSATVGDKTQTVDIGKWDENHTYLELDYPDYLEVTGTFKETPDDGNKTDDKKDEDKGCGSAIGIGTGAMLVTLLAGSVAAVAVKKKKD